MEIKNGRDFDSNHGPHGSLEPPFATMLQTIS
jgi:hypothetical protein